jgi:hypothetical protein
VGDDLGVRVGGEDRAAGDQLLLELHVVLDDAVDHDVHAVLGVEVRVRVALRDPAVRRPAGVADPRRGGRREGGDRAVVDRGRGDRCAQVLQVADGAHRLQPALALQGDAGGVITAVFELLETGQEDLLHRAVTDVADDAAHGNPFSVTPIQRTRRAASVGRLGAGF